MNYARTENAPKNTKRGIKAMNCFDMKNRKDVCNICPCRYWCNARTRRRNKMLVETACRFAVQLFSNYKRVNNLELNAHEEWVKVWADAKTLAELIEPLEVQEILSEENCKEALNFRKALFSADEMLKNCVLLPVRRGFILHQNAPEYEIKHPN